MFNALLPLLAQEESGDGGVRTCTFHRRSADAPRSVWYVSDMTSACFQVTLYAQGPSASSDKVMPPSSGVRGQQAHGRYLSMEALVGALRLLSFPFPCLRIQFNDFKIKAHLLSHVVCTDVSIAALTYATFKS